VDRLLLGIDVGTTGVRAALVDSRGRLVANASERCAIETPAPGRAEVDPELWWTALEPLVARIGAQAPMASLDAIGVTGQAPTAVLVDDDGRPLGRAILWLDVRADAQARALEHTLGPGVAEAIGGNRMHAYFLGPKLAWLREHEPETFGRAAHVLQSHAFIVHRLTGQAICDPSTAMLCAPLFDPRRLAWSPAGAAAVGVSPGVLPRIARAQDVIGAVTHAAARATGLREGTPVVAGGGDFAAAALGAGVVDEGQACLMLGTAGNLLMPMKLPRFDPRLINSHHVGCDRWLSLGGTLCGAALEWFRGTCAPGTSWDELESEAAGIDVGASGLTVLPYFQGERTPIWNERARAVFFGVDLTHGRGHLYRAVIDGIALSFRHCLAVAEELGVRFAEVVAANGAGQSPLLRQALSDALGVPLTWAKSGGGTVVGAAALAGLGVGALDEARPMHAWRRSAQEPDPAHHLPNPEAHAKFEALFERRVSLYEAVRGMFAENRREPT
jgi:xylulokinase